MNGYSEVNLTRLRHELHKYPELSGQEHQTAIRITRFLNATSPDRLIDGLGGTGIAAVYQGSTAGPRVMVRCEMDALPIQEENLVSYRSAREGVGHLCGHDGHMAVVCGLGSLLGYKKPERGTVILLFQPAEETGAGSAAVVSDQRFKEIMPDYIFSMHNLPGYRKGTVVTKEKAFTSYVNSIIIRLKGKKAHAAEPMRGNNPANAVAEVIEKLRQAEVRDLSDPAFSLLTPVYLHMGNIAYGISADEAEIHYTLRSHSEEHLSNLETYTADLVRQIANEHRLELSLNWTQRFTAVNNDIRASSWIREAAQSLHLPVHEAALPFNWGEDFGVFTGLIPGAMFGLGAGQDSPALHQNDYDFPDDMIGTGIEMFNAILRQALST